MILVHLEGGLGNQLFQYATGSALAAKHGTALKLVTRGFNRTGRIRNFRLDQYRVTAAIASSQEESHILLARPWRYLRPHPQRPRVKERYFHFDPAVLDAPDDVCLRGNWQSEKYFLTVESELRRELVPRHKPGRSNLEMARRINSACAVSLHIRRGDYVSNPVALAYHGLCGSGYYRKAIERIAEAAKAPHFFVFSDDIAWAEENLETGFPTTFVNINDVKREYEDLRLMSLCQHHIIANSSFSWWGAWLCNDPGKIVIAPQNWFQGAAHDTSDLLPDTWIRL
jgi:hypothetical protein